VRVIAGQPGGQDHHGPGRQRGRLGPPTLARDGRAQVQQGQAHLGVGRTQNGFRYSLRSAAPGLGGPEVSLVAMQDREIDAGHGDPQVTGTVTVFEDRQGSLAGLAASR
jgi:hypothetical protein